VSYYDVNLTHNELMSKLLVPYFVSYASAKCYLNWFTVGKIISKIKRVNFFLRQWTALRLTELMDTGRWNRPR